MTTEQYSRIQRALGRLEGIAYGIREEDVKRDFFFAMESLDAAIDEAYQEDEPFKEADNGGEGVSK